MVSPTLKPSVVQLPVERLMLSRDSLYVADVLHLFYIVTRMEKQAALYKLIEYEDPSSSMIFCKRSWASS